MIMTANPRMSFPVKYGWNGILSVFLSNASGLFEPVWFINSRWIIVIAAIVNGIRKYNAKNRVRFGLSRGIVLPAGKEHKEQTNSLFLSGFKARSCSI